MSDEYTASDSEDSRRLRTFNPSKVAAASAIVAAALHDGDVSESVEAIVAASLQGEIDRIGRINDARKGSGRRTYEDIRVIGFFHWCDRKPQPPPTDPWDRPQLNRYWSCTVIDGCYYCGWIEYVPVLKD